MHCVLVSHFHWDREWYRTFEAFRARLVDAIDRLIDLLETDPDPGPGSHWVRVGSAAATVRAGWPSTRKLRASCTAMANG